jgi:hypothetical protein
MMNKLNGGQAQVTKMTVMMKRKRRDDRVRNMWMSTKSLSLRRRRNLKRKRKPERRKRDIDLTDEKRNVNVKESQLKTHR